MYIPLMSRAVQKACTYEPPAPAVAMPRAHRSVSRQMADRFARRKAWRHSVAVVYVALLAVYLGWRFTIINPDSLFLSVAYYVAECTGFVLGLTAIVTSWSYHHRDPLPAPPGLSVDVLVPVYKEPLHIIRRTLMAAKAIDYPHQTFMLDDGKRDELKALAAELGVKYLRRPDNSHAKAGNLNYGLAHSKADFVMAFDADHIALPHALDVLLGFFADEKVAMVQTPQDYYNTDAFQFINARSGALWHDQSFFYNIVQPSGDGANAASCVGTGAVYRRAALDDIGGIPVDTVTEDIHTSLKLHKRGWRTAYLNEPVAYGIAASDLAEYYKTRRRWGHGNLHALAVEKIWSAKGLTPRQRFQYMALGIIYLEGWQQLLLFLVPVIALVFGLQPFKITIFNVLVVLLFPFVGYALLQEIGCGFTRFWANEIFAMARFPTSLAAFAGLFCGRIPFRSSSKNVRGRVDWKLMAPQLGVAAASLFALGIGLHNLRGDYTPGPLLQYALSAAEGNGVAPGLDINAEMPQGYTIDLVAIAGFWAFYSALRAAFFAHKVIRDARNSHEYFRFALPFPAAVGGRLANARTERISETWARVTLCGDGPLPAPGETVALTLFMPAGPLQLALQVERAAGRTFEGSFAWQGGEARRDQLANGLYSVDWHREFRHRAAYFATPSDAVLRLFGIRATDEARHGPWRAALVGGSHYGILADDLSEKGRASLIAFEDHAPGDALEAQVFSGSAIWKTRLQIIGQEPLSSLSEKGLDGARVARYRVQTVAQSQQA